MRLEGKTALIMGAGQSPGQGVGNGRQPALIEFARASSSITVFAKSMIFERS